MSTTSSNIHLCALPAIIVLFSLLPWVQAASPRDGVVTFVEAEEGLFTGSIDEHCCWRVLLGDAPQSTHSGRGFVDAKNRRGSHAEVPFEGERAGHHRLSVRYTHNKPGDRAAELRINDGVFMTSLAFPQTGRWSARRTAALPLRNSLPAELGVPKPEEILAASTFAGTWDPERTTGPVVRKGVRADQRFAVTFSEPITVTARPRLALSGGHFADYVASSGGGVLLFSVIAAEAPPPSVLQT